MSEQKPHEHLAASTAAYSKAHETVRAHASRLKAEREAKYAQGAQASGLVDQAVQAGIIHAGKTIGPDDQA